MLLYQKRFKMHGVCIFVGKKLVKHYTKSYNISCDILCLCTTSVLQCT